MHNQAIPEKLYYTNLQKLIIGLVDVHPGITLTELSTNLNRHKDTIRYNLRILNRLEKVKMVNQGKYCYIFNRGLDPLSISLLVLIRDQRKATVIQMIASLGCPVTINSLRKSLNFDYGFVKRVVGTLLAKDLVAVKGSKDRKIIASFPLHNTMKRLNVDEMTGKVLDNDSKSYSKPVSSNPK